ncbi:MAG: PIN domain-containing protein [Solirubrobacterales bacterium]|nr:PIN domain-containing protein [Solirubrobacterales bacterium]
MVFVDTSFLYAATDERDSLHSDAARIVAGLEDTDLVTTTHVLGESWTLTRRRLGHAAASRLVDGIRGSRLYTIVHADLDAESAAFDWLLRHDERSYSFVDAVSFQTMRGRGIGVAMAFDADFEAAGFQTLQA